jgi:hypothetical protein
VPVPISRKVGVSASAVLLSVAAVSSGSAALAGEDSYGMLGEPPAGSEQPYSHTFSLSAVEDDGRQIMFNIRGGHAYQFRASINSGGGFSSSRLDASFTAISDITPDVNVRFTFGYEFDSYSFRGTTGFGGLNPWDDIHTIGFGIIFGANLTDDLRLFAGPVFQFSAESGASFSDGFIGGGVFGASYQITPDLRLGAGIGVVSQLGRSVRPYPIITVDWAITEQLRLSSHTSTNAVGDTGLELIYNWGGGIETAIGGAYRWRRFRLDDGGPVSEGIGEHVSYPFWVRLTYHLNRHVSINLFGGAVFEGRVRLMNSGGTTVARSDYDPAGLIGISGSIRF